MRRKRAKTKKRGDDGQRREAAGRVVRVVVVEKSGKGAKGGGREEKKEKGRDESRLGGAGGMARDDGRVCVGRGGDGGRSCFSRRLGEVAPQRVAQVETEVGPARQVR
jgi:hypothetical protein